MSFDTNSWLQQFTHLFSEDILISMMRLMLFLGLNFIFYFVSRHFIVRAIHVGLNIAQFKWESYLVQYKIFEKSALLVAFLAARIILPFTLQANQVASILTMLLDVLVTTQTVRVLFSLFDMGYQISEEKRLSAYLPIKSMVQLLKLFLTILTLILVASILSHRSPAYLLSGLGVATGLVALMFRDTILGFVAGIQLAANRMVTQGDWIEMPSYGADGSVEEVSLTTVKVRNWDKTISMIPAYALISHSFKNWRGMEESGGRRIKRSLLLDVSSIIFLDAQDIEEMMRIDLLQDHLQQKKTELSSDEPWFAGERKLTNIGVFRAYVEAYLKAHKLVRQDMTCIVRQLAPNEFGVPIEIYVFVADIRWREFESIQSDIFDHLFAILPEFKLSAYQRPSSSDLATLAYLTD
tara:strand:+ start:29269 stop:30495 length:1227 start_codon:yes stop_codon:yes gene_type:complete